MIAKYIIQKKLQTKENKKLNILNNIESKKGDAPLQI